jgi:hypothetical protein
MAAFEEQCTRFEYFVFDDAAGVDVIVATDLPAMKQQQ